MRHERVARSEIDSVLAKVAGMPVSRVWRGYGTAVFFELGQLRPHKNLRGVESPQGEVSVMIEWSWRVEKRRSIWFGAFSSQKMIASRLPQLVGHQVIAASLEGRLPELRMTLSGGLWFGSYMCEQGSQEWVIFTAVRAYYAKGTAFYSEPRRANKKRNLDNSE